MATSRRHPFFLLYRTSHPPNYTDVTQHAATPGGSRSRYSGPNERRSADGQAPGTGTLRMGFAQFTTSRSRLARTRHHRRQSSITSEFGDVIEFRRPGPTPSDAASPVCPSRHHTAGYGQFPPPVCRECNTAFIPSRYSHYTITYYIRLHHYILHSHAPTDPTGVGSQGIGKTPFFHQNAELSLTPPRPACRLSMTSRQGPLDRHGIRK